MRIRTLIVGIFFGAACLVLQAQPFAKTAQPEKMILDTDIGDDIDDAYALALLLQSPEVKIVGITTAFGDTQLRARLVTRFLKETGRAEIPVYAGPETAAKAAFTQADWAKVSPEKKYADAVAFILETVRKSPGQITLVSIGPLTNVGAAIAKDPAAFRKVKRVVLMGGSIHRGYDDPAGGHPDPEWNIACDIKAAQALFRSGVPLFVMPLDSTRIKLDAARRSLLFARKSVLTNALQALTQQWSAGTKQDTPTLFDAVAAAYAVDPGVCPMTDLHIEVDDKGMTREMAGQPNAHVCLASSADSFYSFYLPRVMR